MELLAFVLLWPLLLLVLSVLFLSSWDVGGGFLLFPMLIVFIIMTFGLKNCLGNPNGTSEPENLDALRRGIVAFSMGLLLPVWVRYFLVAANDHLAAIVISLAFGFGILMWGMFLKGYKVLTYANIMGGAFTIIYVYFELWNLGQLAQVVGAAFGLVAAVAIAAIKFRDKLVS
jgi:hypothetical protein